MAERLLRAGDVIFNLDRIMKAEFRAGATPVTLSLFLAGGGEKGEATYTSLVFEGDDAKAVWVALSAEASVVPGVKFKP